jgi:hypothetical protein
MSAFANWLKKIKEVQVPLIEEDRGASFFKVSEYQLLDNPKRYRHYRSVWDYSDWYEWRIINGKVCRAVPQQHTIKDDWVPFPEEVQAAYRKHLNKLILSEQVDS